MRCEVRCEVTSIHDDAVTHEFVSFIGGEFVHARPESAQNSERFGSIGARVNEHRLIVQRTEAGIEVVAEWIDQMKRDNRDSQLAHCLAKFLDAAVGRTEAIASINAGPARVP